MELVFEKWQGTGNDFIVVDDWDGRFPSHDEALIRRLCNRHFGIGSDGLILLQSPTTAGVDYHMEFFNPDASKSFCGNGSRCAFAFWNRQQSRMGEEALFTAIDGEHRASKDERGVRVSLLPPRSIEHIASDMDLIDTGSPHLMVWVSDPDAVDLVSEARRHRYSARFAEFGVNVNFLRWRSDQLEMRTYERGVEAETLSCGTGVTAAAIDALHRGLGRGPQVSVRTKGGDLSVEVSREQDRFTSVALIGPAVRVYHGVISV
ncbi:MAG: diaminopimelate epimerase [Flavobacteriales bacterium]|nr:diaminopimelate epimerase [Flavobacteriales bacterium]